MNETLNETESKILEAAKSEFILNGLKGTSMQQIADAAGINKSLLHYYFRSKEKLFNAIFIAAIQQFVPHIKDIVTEDVSVFMKVEKIVDKYMDMLMESPFIPVFIMHEINRNPQRLYDALIQSGLNPKMITDHLIPETDRELIRSFDPVHLIINIIALCVFPVAAKALLEKAFFDDDKERYHRFLLGRNSEIKDFIINAIRLKNN